MNFEKEYFERYKEQKLRTNFFNSLIRNLVKKNSRILDIGCAYGFYLKYLEKDYETYGIDISLHAVEKAKQICKDSKIAVMSAERLEFKNNFFDLILCLDVLEHSINPKKCLENCRAILKNNGFLIVSVPNTKSIFKNLKGKDWFAYKDKTRISVFDREKWEELFKRYNFEILKCFSEGFWDISYFKFLKQLQKIFLIPGVIQYKLKKIIIPPIGENLIYILMCKK